ncbi:MAG: MbtH family protein [Acidimicrobiia bacterium]
MDDDDVDATRIYKVVVNDEGYHSIWPADRPSPLGWTDGGKIGNKGECLQYIGETWTDMTPKGIRKQLDNRDQIITDKGG